MSVRVPTHDGPPTRARRGDDPRARKRVRVVSVVVLGLLASISAVPIAETRTSLEASRQADVLAERLDELRAEALAVQARADRLDAEGAFDEARVEAWFTPVDPLRVRNTLLQAARALRLDVHSIDVVHAEGDGAGGLAGGTVLGIDADATSAGDDELGPRIRTASSFVIAGAGRPSHVLLLSAMLAELQDPLRLERIGLVMDGARATFELEARRLELPPEPEPEPAPEPEPS